MNALLLALLALCHAAAAQIEPSPVSTVSTVVHSSTPSPKPLQLYDSARYACPMDCGQSGLNPSDWTVYHDLNRLSYCNATMLLDFTLFNPLNDPDTHTTIRTCAFGANNNATLRENLTPDATATRIAKRNDSSINTCVSLGKQEQVPQTLQIAFNGSESSVSLSDFNAAAYVLAGQLATQEPSCEQTISFAYSNTAVIGVYVGSALQSQGLATSVLQSFVDSISSGGYSESNLVQLCSNQSSEFIMGVVANANADLAAAQEVVATWASGGCISTNDRASVLDSVSVTVPSLVLNSTITSTNGTASTNGTYQSAVSGGLSKRGDCTTIKVASGDSCSSLASKCGITPAQFTDYNNEPNECSTLTPGEHVCCTAGTLPDYAPKPYSNGTCYTYYVQPGDYCSELAASYSITVDQIGSFNDNTWGFMGCSDLQAGETICLSSGAPPMPAYIQNSVCGPQVVGTPIVPAGTNLSLLSQCPLFACCDIWGQCGTTAEFCTQSKSPTGAPGTAAQGTNGCISNCGTEIVTGEAPSTQFKVGYFEGFNLQRPCLNQPIQNMDFSAYTHIHLAFAGITSGFSLDVSSIQEQFTAFISMSGGFKKILSVGGWAFSTDSGTYDLFRQAVTEANQQTFANNIVSFITNYGLDGIDLDWEYPGEPDIPGIPAGTIADGYNFAAFLQILKPLMPAGKTVSFTAPASFWYLQAFPLFEMYDSMDYVVYMTYDLHGQWDYGNKWSDPGCPGGNCLRSDVNLTETISALSMITKAGIPANKIVVGVTSYGRSFQMTTQGCYTEECTYTGPSSGAYAGQCTGTAGYISNAEIDAIIAGNATVFTADGSPVSISGTPYTYLDKDSFSNILVYNDNQWVGYMDDANKAERAQLYAGYNFLGTADWALDLQSFNGDGGSSGDSGTVISVSPSLWNGGNPTVVCEPPCIFVLPPYPLGYTSTITWPVLTTTLLSSTANSIVTITTTINVPPFTITDISLQPVTLQPTETQTYFVNPVQSVTPSSFIWTLGPNEATFPPTPIITPGESVGGPGASGFNGNPNPGTATSSTTLAAVILPGVTFHSTPFPITIQPQPTVSITIPTPKTPAVTISTGTPEPDCTGPTCGQRDCGIFGCGGGCGEYACGGGCGIFGCGGGCGPFGCSSECPLDQCGGLDCTVPGSCGGGEGDGEDDDGDCDDPATVSACTYYVSSFTTAPNSYTTTTSTECSTTTACDGENTSETVTPQACSAFMTAAYATARAAGGYSTDGGYVPYAFAGTAANINGVVPATVPYFGYSLSSTTSNCDACTYIDGDPLVCTNVNGCTQQQTVTSSTPTATSTQAFTPAPTATADCEYWIIHGLWYTFYVYNIDGWSNDGGASLHKQEDGCGPGGGLTDWQWHPADQDYAYASFNLDFFIKSGCVERAIISAGGPKLQCAYKGDVGQVIPLRRDLIQKRDPTTFQPSYSFDGYTPSYSYNTTFSTAPTYTPATWNSGSVVTLTSTYYSTSVYTTSSVVTGNSTVPFPAATATQTSSASPTATATSTPYTVSTNGTCGPSQPGKMTCAGSSFGDCCGAFGECGSTAGYCGNNYGCQSTFSSPGACYTPPADVSTNGTCGPSQPGNMTCVDSQYGDCCSAFGECGSTAAYCSNNYGCQGKYSSGCTDPVFTVSTNGTCGSNQPGDMTCAGSQFGSCCSAYGECGSGVEYCSTDNDCQGAYSNGCYTPPVHTISTNGTCGPTQPGNMTCVGSKFGDCCGAFGECGSTGAYCASAYGCQPQFSTGCLVHIVTNNGTCGPSQPNNMTCADSNYGPCCGSSGECGSTDSFCSLGSGCQIAWSSGCN